MKPPAGTAPHADDRRLPRVVWATGWVSFFTDLSTEMIYGLLPAYYTATLSINVAWQGFIEGAAESIVAITKLFSGALSDRTGGRKWWMVAGYGLSTVSKPLLALAESAGAILALRSADRLGKGVRGAPRDALISLHTTQRHRGGAFGVQRAMDHAGALAGGLIAAALLALQWVTLTELFWWTAVPGGVAVLIIILFVHDRRAQEPARALRSAFSIRNAWRAQTRTMKRFVLIVALFSLGNSTDLLVLKLIHDRLIEFNWAEHHAASALPLLWAWLHVVKSIASPIGGRLSDRMNRFAVLRAGWLIYAAVYAGFALSEHPVALIVLFSVYGLYYALTESPQRAIVADLISDELHRGAAYGLLHFAIGLTVFPASVICGVLWLAWGPVAAFATGAALALLAALIIPWVTAGRAS